MVTPPAVSLTHGGISRKVFLFEHQLFEAAKAVQVCSAVLEEHKIKDLLLLKETVQFAGANYVPAAPAPCSFLLHLRVAHTVKGSGNGFPGGSGCALCQSLGREGGTAGCWSELGQCCPCCRPGLQGCSWDLLLPKFSTERDISM